MVRVSKFDSPFKSPIVGYRITISLGLFLENDAYPLLLCCIAQAYLFLEVCH